MTDAEIEAAAEGENKLPTFNIVAYTGAPVNVGWGFPVVVDYNWWSHSICALDLVSLSPFRIRIWNSWGDSWSEGGTGILEGGKAIPNGALVALVQTPSIK